MRPRTPASFLRRTKGVSSERIPFSAGENFQLSARNPCSSRRALRKIWRLRSGSPTAFRTLSANMGNFGCRRQRFFVVVPGGQSSQGSLKSGAFEALGQISYVHFGDVETVARGMRSKFALPRTLPYESVSPFARRLFVHRARAAVAALRRG